MRYGNAASAVRVRVLGDRATLLRARWMRFAELEHQCVQLPASPERGVERSDALACDAFAVAVGRGIGDQLLEAGDEMTFRLLDASLLVERFAERARRARRAPGRRTGALPTFDRRE